MITIRGLKFRTLTIGHLDIPPGWTVLAGLNGSGKSSFIECFTGFSAFSGEISIDAKPVGGCPTGWLPPFPDRGFVFNTVEDEVASPLRFAGVPCRETQRRLLVLAERAGILELLDREVQTLSGGEKVLAALATALATDPAVLLIDEAFSSLDPGTRDRVEEVVRVCRPRYVIEATHDMGRALMRDQVILLEKGNILARGTPQEVIGRLRGTPFEPLEMVIDGAGL
jgi:energy-coupling factor transport system ATP-binding protein